MYLIVFLSRFSVVQRALVIGTRSPCVFEVTLNGGVSWRVAKIVTVEPYPEHPRAKRNREGGRESGSDTSS